MNTNPANPAEQPFSGLLNPANPVLGERGSESDVHTRTPLDFHTLLDDPQVLDVVGQARAAGAKFYPLAAALAVDDLESWLPVRAVEFARWWTTTPEGQDGDRDHFRRALYRHLTGAIRRGEHLQALYGKPGSSRQTNRAPAHLDAPTGDGLTLGGTLTDETADPLRIILLRERLEALIDKAATAVRVDDGGCLECNRPVHLKRLCTVHYNRRIRANLGACHCGKPVRAKGLCSGHWWEQRAATAPECTTPECHNPVRSRGLCNRHYIAARKAAEQEKQQ